MIEILKQLLLEKQTEEQKYNILREYLQHLMLKILFDRKAFCSIAFVGGTALRILYDLKRYSEDMDFSLINAEDYDFECLMNLLTSDLSKYGLQVEGKLRVQNTVHSSMFKFSNLLKDLGFKVHRERKLMIKLDVDTNPPLGSQLDRHALARYFMTQVMSYDKPSLFAGKLHACLCRKYTKGRDYYDLLWYLGQKVKPNYVMLNNALKQTEADYPLLSSENLADALAYKIETTSFKQVHDDVVHFLENDEELNLLNQDFFLQILKSASF